LIQVGDEAKEAERIMLEELSQHHSLIPTRLRTPEDPLRTALRRWMMMTSHFENESLHRTHLYPLSTTKILVKN
jgi:hypothetical protein